MNLFEANILVWIQDNIRIPALDGIVSFISRMGDKGILWICVALALITFKRTRKLGICCAVSMVFTLILVNGCIKPIVARIRPYNLNEMIDTLKVLVPAEHDFSFPSGHSANSFACAWVIFAGVRKRYGVPALVMAILIALSRLYVGVHYPLDVVCGIVCGIICAEIAMRVTPKLMERVGSEITKRAKNGSGKRGTSR